MLNILSNMAHHPHQLICPKFPQDCLRGELFFSPPILVRKTVDMDNQHLALGGKFPLDDTAILAFALFTGIIRECFFSLITEYLCMRKSISIGELLRLYHILALGADSLVLFTNLEYLFELFEQWWDLLQLVFHGVEQLNHILMCIFLVLTFGELMRPFLFQVYHSHSFSFAAPINFPKKYPQFV